MLATDRVREAFAEAHTMHDDAMDHLAAGDLRNAAGKAWEATLCATNALLLAKTGKEPQLTSATSRGLDKLAQQEPAAKNLVGRYYSRQISLHENCYDLGLCEPPETIQRRIRETADYVRDAENLAAAGER